MPGTVTTRDEVLIGDVDLSDTGHVIVRLPSGPVVIPDGDVLDLELNEAA